MRTARVKETETLCSVKEARPGQLVHIFSLLKNIEKRSHKNNRREPSWKRKGETREGEGCL